MILYILYCKIGRFATLIRSFEGKNDLIKRKNGYIEEDLRRKSLKILYFYALKAQNIVFFCVKT